MSNGWCDVYQEGTYGCIVPTTDPRFSFGGLYIRVTPEEREKWFDDTYPIFMARVADREDTKVTKREETA